MNPQQILGIVVVLMVAPVALAIGVNVVFETTGSLDSTVGRVSTTENLLNVTFTENTGASPDNWDNGVDNATLNSIDTSLNFVFSRVTDNGDVDGNGTGIIENGWFYQSLTLASIRDGVASATVTAQYQLDDNENLEAINSYIYLDDGTDNTEVWTDNSIENSSTWTSISVDVTDNVDAAGTYTLYLLTEIKPDNSQVGSNIQVEWNAADLIVVTYASGYLENAVEDVENQTSTGFSLGSLMPLIIAAVALVTIIVVGFVGLKLGGTRKWR